MAVWVRTPLGNDIDLHNNRCVQYTYSKRQNFILFIRSTEALHFLYSILKAGLGPLLSYVLLSDLAFKSC